MLTNLLRRTHPLNDKKGNVNPAEFNEVPFTNNSEWKPFYFSVPFELQSLI